MASKFALDLAVAQERIRGLEAQVALLSKALEQSLSGPAVVYQGDGAGARGPGFGLLAAQMMANADEPEPTPPPPPPAPAVTWFRADGGDPAEPRS